MTQLQHCFFLVLVLNASCERCRGYVVGPNRMPVRNQGLSGIFSPRYSTATRENGDKDTDRFVDAVPIISSVTDPEAVRLRDELLSLSNATNRGFQASPAQRNRAKDIILDLAKFNPTIEPATPYYPEYTVNSNDTTQTNTLAGKWDLIYTDAPDITSLDTSRNPLATATLGRIGQECEPPYIKNVIEWKKPEWLDQLPLPLAGTSSSRILQKVCTKATATDENPKQVDLELVGIDLVAPSTFPDECVSYSIDDNKLQQDIRRDGLVRGFLKNNPLELRGPLTAPFGRFEVFYLD